MRIKSALFIVCLACFGPAYGQFLIPAEGIVDVRLGIDWDEVEWELGFRGERIEKSHASTTLDLLAKAAGIDYDFVVSYQHLMWLPVSDLFFKDDKICMIQLSSYPEYNKMICADIGTVEGLNFWDNKEKVKEIYGNFKEVENEGKSYLIYNEKGIGVEILDNEVRTMLIFQAQMK